MAVAAGLLHDIGMLHVDPQILDPDTALTPRQRRRWHPHPLVSTAMVARDDVYPPHPAVGRAGGEFTLRTREACWQLGTLALPCRRRWQLEPHATCPPVMQQRLDAVGALALTVSGLAREPPQEGEAPAGPARGDRVARVPSSPR
jgi:hypothetical protein